MLPGQLPLCPGATSRSAPRAIAARPSSSRSNRRCNNGVATRPRWPMIVMRTPKEWTGPREVDGHKVEAFWRAHQVPMPDVVQKPEHLQILEQWMRSYKPEELFDANGTTGSPESRSLVRPLQAKDAGGHPAAKHHASQLRPSMWVGGPA